jgi:hypothetical protein
VALTGRRSPYPETAVIAPAVLADRSIKSGSVTLRDGTSQAVIGISLGPVGNTVETGVALPALNEGSVFGLGSWIGHGEEVDEDHMVTLQIVLTTVDKEWIFVPRLALPQQQTIIADEQPADAAPLESVKAAALSGVTVVRRPQTAAPDLLMLMLS